MAKNNIKGCLFACAGYACYVAHDLIVKLLSAHYSVLQITFFALLFCFPFLTLIALSTRPERGIWPNHPWLSITRMVLLVGASLFAYTAFSRAPLVDVYTLLLTQPLIVTLLSVLILKEPINRRRVFAIILGVAGTTTILQPGYQDINFFHILAIASALLYSFSSIILSKISQRENLLIVFIYPVMGSIVFTGIAMIGVYVPPTLPHLLLLMLQGILLIGAGFTVNLAYRLTFASLVVPFQYTQLVWSMIIGFLLFGNVPDELTMAGAMMVVASGLFILWSETSSGSTAKFKARYALNSETEAEPMEIVQEDYGSSLLVDREEAEKQIDVERDFYRKSRFTKK